MSSSTLIFAFLVFGTGLSSSQVQAKVLTNEIANVDNNDPTVKDVLKNFLEEQRSDSSNADYQSFMKQTAIIQLKNFLGIKEEEPNPKMDALSKYTAFYQNHIVPILKKIIENKVSSTKKIATVIVGIIVLLFSINIVCSITSHCNNYPMNMFRMSFESVRIKLITNHIL